MEPEVCRSGQEQGLSPTLMLTESGRVKGLPCTTLTSGFTSRKQATPVSSLDEVMRSHGYSSVFSHNVHYTPTQASKAYLPDTHLVWPGRKTCDLVTVGIVSWLKMISGAKEMF